MELTTVSTPAMTKRTGEESGIVLAAGERFRVQKYVSGEIVDVLADVTVPTGKKWTVAVGVNIDETDA